MKIILLILGIISILYFAFVNIVFGYTTFSAFFLVIGICMIAYYLFIEKLLKFTWFQKIFKPGKIIILVGIVFFIVAEICIISYPKKSTKSCDYIIVLGAGIRGENLTTTLRDRLNATLDYIDEAEFKGDIIVSGGQGPGESITEAEAMKRYLVENGIDSDRIILENKSTSTYENFKYSKDVIQKLNNKDIGEITTTIITTDFHALRSNMLANRNGYKNTNLYTSSTKWYLIPSMYAREFFAFGKSIVFDR